MMRRLNHAPRLTRSVFILIAMPLLTPWVTPTLAQGTMSQALRADGSPLGPITAIPLVRNPRNNEVMPVWIANEGAQPTARPGPPGPDNLPVYRARPIRYMESCASALKPEQKGDTEYYFLVRPTPRGDKVAEVYGWFDRRYLVMSTQSIQETYSKIYLKAMIVTTAATIQAPGRPVQARKGVEIRLAANPAAKPLAETIRLFDIYYVFGLTKDFVLLGSRPWFTTIDDRVGQKTNAETIVLGWVPRKQVCFWDTREAFEWNSSVSDARPKPGRIFRTAGDAVQALDGKPVAALFDEVFGPDGRPVSIPHDRMRYPLLEWESNETAQQRYKGNILHRVGVVGGYGAMSLNEVENLRRKLDLIAKQVRTTEILFVIDDTSSMKSPQADWFKIAARAVRKIVQGIGRVKTSAPVTDSAPTSVGGVPIDLRLAVTYYNDDQDGSAGYTPMPLVSAAARDDRNRVQADAIPADLDSHQVHDGGDPRERLFRGLAGGIDKAGFSQFARKMVILLGDVGDKGDPKDPTPKQIADRLVPDADSNDSPIEFYTVQVLPPDGNEDTAAFRDQANEIMSLHVARCSAAAKNGEVPEKLCDYTFASPENVDKVVNQIVERYQNLEVRAKDLSGQVARLRRGMWDTKIAPELEKILAEFGIEVEKLRKNPDVQLFEYGYVWQKEDYGTDQIRMKLLINEDEVNSLTTTLKGVTRDRGQAGFASVSDLIRTEIANQTGQADPSKVKATVSLDDCLFNATGLHFQSDLLKTKVGMIKDAKLASQDVLKVKHRLELLEDMKNNMKYAYKTVDRPGPGGTILQDFVKTGSGEPSPRGFFLYSQAVLDRSEDRSVTYYWVDLLEEWP